MGTTEKVKILVALFLNERGNPRFKKMQVTPNIKQAFTKKFAHTAFVALATITANIVLCTMLAEKNIIFLWDD